MKSVKLKPVAQGSDHAEVVVSSNEFVIGRDPACRLVLNSRLVSRNHCKLILDGEDVHVEDMQSRNGTYVNEHRILGRCRLRDGDLLGVGGTLFRVSVRPATAPARLAG